jgi:hypothetical protein
MVLRDDAADYRYRACLARSEVVARIRRSVEEELEYDNFKNSVSDQRRHGAYVGVWREMKRLQDSEREV